MQHPDGVYFGMSEEEYFADTAIGQTDLKVLATEPADWWWFSDANPLRPKAAEDGDGKRFGKALHKVVLEGAEAYDASYFVRPDAPEGALKTADDIKTALDAAGVAYKKSLKKGELVEALLAHDASAVIYDKWLAEIEEQFAGREEVRSEWDKVLRLVAAIVKAHPQLSNGFKGGYPEVSMFWTDPSSVRYRARFDYLKPQAVFDLKTFGKWRGGDFKNACVEEIKHRCYDVQAAHYIDARRMLPSLIEAGKVFGDVRPEFLKSLVKQGDKFEFVFVFIKTIGSPRILPLPFPQDDVIHAAASEIVAAGLKNYREYLARFGNEMWVEVDPLWQPTSDDWAPLFFRRK